MMKNYIFLFVLLLKENVLSSQLKDEHLNKYNLYNLVFYVEYFDNDHLKISYIDYFMVFPKYERVIRDNYFGYQNNCIESRIYYRNNMEQIYEVYYDREKCNGQIKMIVDKTGEKAIVNKRNIIN
tara:strand:+ start:836 stop:1210 length:375 start_codon:yes stop_codon:yes gene_type:complete